MNDKDTYNLYNIYRNVLKEVKIGDSMSQPIQLGSGMYKGGPNSDVLLKIKRKKPKKVKKINEGILSGIGSFAKGVAQGVQSAQRGQLPTFSKKQEKRDKSTENFKKVTPKVGKRIYISKKNNIKAVIMSKPNQNGDYYVKLIGNTVTDPSPYKFFKTKKYPNGVISATKNIDPADTIISRSDTFVFGEKKNYAVIVGI